MPERDITFDDLVRGPITFPAGTIPDPVLVRGNGEPLYTLVNPVDDALMEITHVLRGEDLLPSTPRQIALYEALADIGVARYTPEFGHLPFVTGEGNRKLSKRDPQSNLFQYRVDGFIREGMVNYLALLGWSLGDDREIFGPAELVAAFDGTRISGNPARFDRKKAEAVNGAHIRLLAPDDFAERLTRFLSETAALPAEPDAEELAMVVAAAPLVQERSTLLSDAAAMLHFLFVGDRFAVEPAAGTKVLTDTAVPALQAAVLALSGIVDFTAAPIEQALRTSLIEGLGLKPKQAFTPVRVAVTGRTVSPPLYESLELLGRTTTMARLEAALATATGPQGPVPTGAGR
jgi:glutamyl-tRNA synthetase